MVWAAVLVSCAVAVARGAPATGAEGAEEAHPTLPPHAPPHHPPRTLDRQDSELAWRNWLQSPEGGGLSSPPRRITTKSLFITPLVCPKGQRLDRNGCVQVVTVNKDDHERILLEQLNALFTAAPPDVLYDYDEEPGPLQLSLPVNLEPQAELLQAPDPAAQAQELNAHYTSNEKKDTSLHSQSGYETELEFLKIDDHRNKTMSPVEAELFSQALSNFLTDQKKENLNGLVKNETTSIKITGEGQKEVIYGQINVDPLEIQPKIQQLTKDGSYNFSDTVNILSPSDSNATTEYESNDTKVTTEKKECQNISPTTSESTLDLNTDEVKHKLNPTDEYSNIGERIKLISRYAEVTTDDNFSKDHKKYATKDDSVLGTRTKLSHRRNRPKTQKQSPAMQLLAAARINLNRHYLSPANGAYYRYPWNDQRPHTPPRDYPFRHLQDYWPDRQIVGGLYATHQNPKRHHHSQHYGSNRLQNLPYWQYGALYAGAKVGSRRDHRGTTERVGAISVRSSDHDDFYNLLNLKHWFKKYSNDPVER